MEHDTLWQALLFDFYGELLTEKQRLLYDLHYNQDYSLAEIAAEEGISRQGVHDSIARAEGLLKHYEEKIGCLARAAQVHDALEEIAAAAAALRASDDGTVRSLAGDILRAAASIKEY